MKRYLLLFFTLLLVVPVAAQDEEVDDEMMEQPVLEIAVRQVKEGRLEEFIETRAAFIEALKGQDGVLADREFASFFALPEPDETEVFIGMTLWASADAAAAAGENLLGGEVANAFFDTIEFKAYVLALPPEEFDLETYAAEAGQVLELAVRATDPAVMAEFEAARDAFVELLDSQEGVVGSAEFEVITQPEDGETVLTVGTTVYSDAETFQAIAAAITEEPETAAYFQTFVPVAAQYAFSASNDESMMDDMEESE